jgi:integrase
MAGRGVPQRRTRGTVRKRGGSYQVVVYAGIDPLTGKEHYLYESAPDAREAERIRTRLLAQVDRQRSTSTRATFGYLLDAWLKVHDIDPGTLASYARTVERRIKPALGDLPVSKLTARVLEEFYADLRRCRDRCNKKPYIVHRTGSPHDCEADDPSTRKQCRLHVCKPYAAATIRETHSIISGALSAAVRWEWIDFNPADVARKPRQPKPNPSPPSPDQASRILAAASEQDPSWGMLVWLTMITGARRGEIVALRWKDVDLQRRILEIRRNLVDGVEKETKTHQIRRIALDETTVELLTAHQARYVERVRLLELAPSDDAFVFSYEPDHSRACDADAVSHRFSAMCDKLGFDTHLHALRHYSATELISAGVDVRTVAGRLGHGGGGTTTLRVYAAWVAESDKRAANLLASRMMGRPPAEPGTHT